MRQYLTTISGADVRRHYASGAWTPDTLVGIAAERAVRDPDGKCLADGRDRLSNAEALAAVNSVAAFLTARGVRRGDPVLISLPNCSRYAVANIAISSLGAVIVPLPTSLRATEVSAVAARVGSRLLITTAAAAGRFAGPEDSGLTVLTDDELPISAGSSLSADTAGGSDPDDPLDLMFTSGTTGVPKGIINTTNTKLSAVRAMVSALGLGPDDSWLVVPPMAHNAGWLYSYIPSLLSGAPAVFQERFEPRQTLQLLIENDVHAVFLTPTHATDVLAEIAAGAALPTVLRYIIIGGAVTPPALKAALREGLRAEVIAMYGCTENQGATFIRPGTPVGIADISVGWPWPGCEVSIFDAARANVLPPNQLGLIGTRGPGTFAGYFDDQGATDLAFNDEGWFFGGDLGVIDANGALQITGRQKELIIRGGLNIAPDDVEQALSGHPDLEGVAAVGIPDSRLGERVCAVVAARRPVDLPAVLSYLRARDIGTHLWPEALLVVDRLPVTDIGKIKRKDLQRLAVAALAEGRLELAGAPARGGS